MVNSRRSHADRSIAAHHKNPVTRIYTVAELERIYDWRIDTMCKHYDDAMLGVCPGTCRRRLLELDRREISIDIIDPEHPPMWHLNTRFMCVPCNLKKSNHTRGQLITARITELTTPAQLTLF
jgi:hypothetical protein